MTVTIASTLNAARLQAVLDFVQASATPAIDFYSTPRPASGAIATGATLLASIDLPNPFAVLASGVLTLVTPQNGLVAASGIVAWARVRTGADDFAMDLDVSVTGDGGDMIVQSTTLYAGGTLRLVSGVIG